MWSCLCWVSGAAACDQCGALTSVICGRYTNETARVFRLVQFVSERASCLTAGLHPLQTVNRHTRLGFCLFNLPQPPYMGYANRLARWPGFRIMENLQWAMQKRKVTSWRRTASMLIYGRNGWFLGIKQYFVDCRNYLTRKKRRGWLNRHEGEIISVHAMKL
jgi:hypothetical protein